MEENKDMSLDSEKDKESNIESEMTDIEASFDDASEMPNNSDVGMTEYEDELRSVKEENLRLKNELKRIERLKTEGEELKLLFPEADMENLPEEVKDAFEGGMLLAAAYSLYDKRMAVAKATAETSNRLNAQNSPGAITSDGRGDGSFSLDDIRRMPKEEVRNYLDRIYRSLENRKKNN